MQNVSGKTALLPCAFPWQGFRKASSLHSVHRKKTSLLSADSHPSNSVSILDTIDRHLACEWLKSLGLTTGAILGLFYIQNLYDNLGDLLEHGAGAAEILQYYLMLTPALLSPVLPLSVLVATLFSYGSLHRNQEITAMRSTGRSVWSLMRVNMFLAALLSAWLFLLGNGGLSKSVEKSREFYEELVQKPFDPASAEVAAIKHLTFENASSHRLWVMNRYDPSAHKGHGVYLYLRYASGQARERFTSRTAEFMPETATWIFREGRQVFFDEAGLSLRFVDFEELKMEGLDPPWALLARQKKLSELSLRELRELAGVSQGGQGSEARRYGVRYHQALAGPFNCMLALLVGVPFAIAGTRVSPMVGATKAIGIFVGYFLLGGAFRMLGQQGILEPVVVGWLPMGLMALYALFLIGRVR